METQAEPTITQMKDGGPGCKHYALYLTGNAPQPDILAPLIDHIPFKTIMPCGESIIINDLEDIPLIDTPCPCGASNHWLVTWNITKGDDDDVDNP